MAFRRAERVQAKARVALIGPSGCGKTYSALLLARGLVGPQGRIAMGDTEAGSGDLYADLTPYDVQSMQPPFSPQSYTALIREAAEEGYDALIVDSLSHAWMGAGGILDMVDNAVAGAGGNKFSAWRDVTPQHNALVDAMIRAPLHLIVTMRAKTAYEVVDDGGKKKPIKIGLSPVQRDGMEYEFTCVFDVAIDRHVAVASKDRTQLFDGQAFVITQDVGQQLRAWLEHGVTAEERETHEIQQLTDALSSASSTDALRRAWQHCYRWAEAHESPGQLAQWEGVKDERKHALSEPAPRADNSPLPDDPQAESDYDASQENSDTHPDDDRGVHDWENEDEDEGPSEADCEVWAAAYTDLHARMDGAKSDQEITLLRDDVDAFLDTITDEPLQVQYMGWLNRAGREARSRVAAALAEEKPSKPAAAKKKAAAKKAAAKKVAAKKKAAAKQ